MATSFSLTEAASCTGGESRPALANASTNSPYLARYDFTQYAPHMNASGIEPMCRFVE